MYMYMNKKNICIKKCDGMDRKDFNENIAPKV